MFQAACGGAVAQQAEAVSEGRINGLVLVLVLGIIRILWGWAIQKLQIPGYMVVLGSSGRHITEPAGQ